MQAKQKTCKHSITVPDSGLMLLPDELLSRILDFVSASEVPVSIERFTDMARYPDQYKNGQKRIYSFPRLGTRGKSSARFLTTAPTFSRAWWLDLLPMDQVEHYLDWVAVNGTSRRIRACGKAAFFREKKYIASTSFFKSLLDGTISHMSHSDQALAQFYIRDLIIPISSHKAASFITLPKISQGFPNLRTMALHMDATPQMISASHPAELSYPRALPAELMEILNEFGFRSRNLKVYSILYASRRSPNLDAELLSALEQNVYPILRTLSRIKKSSNVY
ncbi:MAG: hypothetical protein Q9171_007238 [Xanthocarpia ochracea]